MTNRSGLAAGAVVGMLIASPAYAYIDAGTGSLILQVLLGGLAGLAVGWRFFWHKIKAVLRPEKRDA